METSNPALIRTLLIGLTMECPRGDKCDGCQLLEKRQLPYTDKKAWVRSLADEQLVAIYDEHCRCLEGERAVG